MKIRHDLFVLTMILTLGIGSIAASLSHSQTKDTIPPRDTRLLEKLKTLNTIEAQEKQKKEQLYTGLDSSVTNLKELAESKNETGKIIDENRWMTRKLSVSMIPPKHEDTLIMLLPRIELYTEETRLPPPASPTPEAAVGRVKKQNWLNRLFKFL